MDEELLLLVSRLPGLKAAKKAIEDQIAEICRRVAMETGAPSQPTPLPPNRENLGVDALGRIKRRRKISPELRAQKVELIGKAPSARLLKLASMKSQIKAPQ